jgi:menaquinone-dependent protoporphyrinogen oxidase
MEKVMETKVLVAYASKYGATAEIANKIGEILRQDDLTIDVFPVEQLDGLTSYDAVVLGSAVYYGRWRKEAVNFLKANEDQLSKLPVWFFSSGPIGEGDPVELLDGWRFPPLQQEIADRIQPRDTTVFHGALFEKNLSFFEKWVLNNVKSPVGDSRDWRMITAWAATISQALSNGNLKE